jgi:hypothetical protein
MVEGRQVHPSLGNIFVGVDGKKHPQHHSFHICRSGRPPSPEIASYGNKFYQHFLPSGFIVDFFSAPKNLLHYLWNLHFLAFRSEIEGVNTSLGGDEGSLRRDEVILGLKAECGL